MFRKILAVCLFCGFLFPSLIVHAEDDESCRLMIEILEIKPLVDKGDSFFGIFGGAMEMQLHLFVTDAENTWQLFYPDENAIKAHHKKYVKTKDFQILIEMDDISGDELIIRITAIDADDIVIFGEDISDELASGGGLIVGAGVDIVAPYKLDQLAEMLVKEGIESVMDEFTGKDKVGEGGFILHGDDGWETEGIQVFTTGDKAISIKYRISLIGEDCD